MPVRGRLSLFVIALGAIASAQVTTPKAFFGFDVCDDYQLANYQQLSAYWKKLATESPRIQIVSIGKSEGGRDQLMAIISDPENLKNLESIRRANIRLMRAKDHRTDTEARAAVANAKAVVWIDGGLHANEVLGAQQLIEQAYQMVSRNDDENRRILRDTVTLLAHANPDGMDLVSDWYMRRSVPSERSAANLPVLYQKYAGHDNNRDFYQMNLAETRNINRILYEEWLPQVVYNHHQSSPAGTIMFIPPFRNPFNYHVDALVQNSTDLVGLHMHNRLIGEGKGGTVMRDGAGFSAWWNGGLRTTTYFHNMVGILTETWGSPNPAPLRFLPERQVPSIDLPKPIDMKTWHLKDSLAYEIGANYAILDYASRYRDHLIFAAWRAGRNSIERGQRDHWTRYPSRIRDLGEKSLTDPAHRDARAYLIPPDQPDRGATQRFINILLRAGIEVSVLTAPSGNYKAGTWVVNCDQAFRPHILDMFEPQDYPNDFRYPGGPPIPPYDNAGYTPAYQMGVKFIRSFEPVTGPMRPETDSRGLNAPISMGATSVIAPAGENESFAAVNQALKLGLNVWRKAIDNPGIPKGSFIISGPSASISDLAKTAKYGIIRQATGPMTREAGIDLRRPRIALWDRYGGSMPSGWTRWLLDEFGYTYDVVFAPDLDAGNLGAKYDVIILPSGANISTGAATTQNPIIGDATVSDQYKKMWGTMSEQKTVPALRDFVEAGGHLIAIGSSAQTIVTRLGLPLTDALTEVNAEGRTVPLPNTKFYIPGSVLRVRLNEGDLTLGMPLDLDVMFDDSPAFTVAPGTPGVEVIATFPTDKPLRSGWAWGQEKLKGTIAMADVTLGNGKIILYGPEVNFRGQSHAAFKLIFNAITRAVLSKQK